MKCPEPEESSEMTVSSHNNLSMWTVEISGESISLERNPEVNVVERFDVLPSYDHIFRNYLLRNVPFILGKLATKDWRSCQEWVTLEGKPNLQYLRESFGAATVPVANCKREKFSSQPKTDMTVAEYTQYWESYMKADYPPGMENLYLKDWHFTRDFPDYEAYTTPIYFTSDWLNEFWDSRCDEKDDYRFVYMGPKGSWTPFHADVLRSFSWSANVCGRKKWIFYPPGQEKNLKDCFGNLPYDVLSPELKNVKKFPHALNATNPIEVIQEAGEIIYVPSGWHHQVHNLEDTISINHNWINGCNIDISWWFLVSNLQDVENEIWDCCFMEGWDEQCQRNINMPNKAGAQIFSAFCKVILKASSGIDFKEFYSFMLTIATNRLTSLKQLRVSSGKCDWTVNKCCHDNMADGCISQKEDVTSVGTKLSDESRQQPEQSDFQTRTNENIHVKMLVQGETVKPSITERSTDTEYHTEPSEKTKATDFTETEKNQKLQTQSCFSPENVDSKHRETPKGCDRLCVEAGFIQKNVKTKFADSVSCDLKQKYASSGDGIEKYNNSNNNRVYDKNLILFDLRRLENVLTSMLNCEEFSVLDFCEHSPSPRLLLMQIQYVLQNKVDVC